MARTGQGQTGSFLSPLFLRFSPLDFHSFSSIRNNLDQVSDIHWHLLDLSVVELFNVLQGSLVLLGNEVDGSSFTSESTTSTNPRGRM